MADLLLHRTKNQIETRLKNDHFTNPETKQRLEKRKKAKQDRPWKKALKKNQIISVDEKHWPGYQLRQPEDKSHQRLLFIVNLDFFNQSETAENCRKIAYQCEQKQCFPSFYLDLCDAVPFSKTKMKQSHQVFLSSLLADGTIRSDENAFEIGS